MCEIHTYRVSVRIKKDIFTHAPPEVFGYTVLKELRCASSWNEHGTRLLSMQDLWPRVTGRLCPTGHLPLC